jgi:hypothetical protein
MDKNMSTEYKISDSWQLFGKAGAFAERGMGTQYVTSLPIQLLVDKGILIRFVISIP